MLVRYFKSKGIVVVLLILTSCADTVKDDYVEQTVETLYNKALNEMEAPGGTSPEDVARELVASGQELSLIHI